MNQTERRIFLIKELLREQPRYSDMKIPADEQEQSNLLRSLFNIRMPEPVSEVFLEEQNAYLQEEIRRKGITELSGLKPMQDGIYLWQGDITTLRCDSIVNAANAQMLGCFCPCHGCIDNAIHTFSGVQLRAACYRSCLELAEKNNVKSIAFCCISTGEFHFPNDKAAEIAVKTVKEYRQQTHSKMEVIFNVFKDVDYKIYRDLLGTN